tara:strand:- start:290 stop:676 length:387 start_codon:yes stop_codon:yes gene_type:complete
MSDWVCSICLESNDEDTVRLEPCNHKFHAKCVVTALRINGPSCPYCRGIDTRCNKKNENVQDNIDPLDISVISNTNYSREEFEDFISLLFNDDLATTDIDQNMDLDINIDSNIFDDIEFNCNECNQTN